jgi:hypothetical protein
MCVFIYKNTHAKTEYAKGFITGTHTLPRPNHKMALLPTPVSITSRPSPPPYTKLQEHQALQVVSKKYSTADAEDRVTTLVNGYDEAYDPSNPKMNGHALYVAELINACANTHHEHRRGLLTLANIECYRNSGQRDVKAFIGREAYVNFAEHGLFARWPTDQSRRTSATRASRSKLPSARAPATRTTRRRHYPQRTRPYGSR